MSNPATIASHLAARFAEKRIVVWHDHDGGHEPDLENQVPSGVTVLRVVDNEFAIKHRILRQDPTAQFLLYRSGPVLEGVDNWLLDVELAYGPAFTADRGALMSASLGLTSHGADAEALIAEHASFFADATLVEKLKKLLMPGDDLKTVRAKMSAVVIGQKEHSFSELTRTLLIEHTKGGSTEVGALSEFGLTDFHWDGAKKIYGYSSDSPTMPGFILWMFQQARDGFDVASSSGARNLAIDFRSFRDSKRSADAIKALANKAEVDINYKDHVAEIAWQSLKETDIFEATEREVIRRLVEAIATQTLPQRDILETISARRRDSFWFDDYAALYEALTAAAELLPMIRTARLDFTSFDEGLSRYRDELFRIDQLYRQFTYAYQTAEFKQPLDMLAERVEAAYVTDFLSPLGMSWQQQVDTVDQWSARALSAQSSFYQKHVATLVKGGHKKAVVVISDALRYEVAKELESRILGLDKFNAKTEAMLGVLPSYTQLGMAALLPHDTLAHSPDGDPVLADGLRSDGLANRNNILKSVDGAAIQAKDFVDMRNDERRELYSLHQVLYVYHDTIDATGDKAASERRTFKAAAEAIDELIDIVKKLVNANATNIFVTADHGFLYQRSKLAPQFNLTVKPQGDSVVVENRRYVLGRGLKENAAFRTFQPRQLGLSSELEVQIPNSIHRIVKPGAGFQFVHGGASLQEIVVPVVAINKGRSTTVEPVNVDIYPETDKITTGQIVVKLQQSMKVEPQRPARRLRAGLYFGELLISNEKEMVFDSESAEGRDRFQSVRLLLSMDAGQANNQRVEFRLSEPIDGTDQWKKYKSAPYLMKRAFASDDGWDF
ncbi:BREX-1 system phosphatase PglZ type A [Psychromicrobium xiongbiense]|uniref:BREX-1 system phosphatase PglZ type A n=1 Tax=Psychromicrobium xiongbiense TaxID=3051184 RepID=UPI00255465EC|nr:BREX-1 system phosphatase PglZ type A [Psychromicrobium sp. YIM S02556]